MKFAPVLFCQSAVDSATPCAAVATPAAAKKRRFRRNRPTAPSASPSPSPALSAPSRRRPLMRFLAHAAALAVSSAAGFFAAVPEADAADRYWTGLGGDGLWSNTANWGSTSGSTTGVSVPGSGDVVYLDNGAAADQRNIIITSNVTVNRTEVKPGGMGYTITINDGVTFQAVNRNDTGIYVDEDLIINGPGSVHLGPDANSGVLTGKTLTINAKWVGTNIFELHRNANSKGVWLFTNP
ncbi:MAG: hypothetical protein LBS59_00380, partial [Puniceicoccales bacterium]|nr:hypothetical protein [Puniceicoccales bacterium]